MCDCRERIEGLLTRRYASKYPEAKDHKATLMGYGFGLSDAGVKQTAFMPAELISMVTVKKTGLEKRKTEKVNMHFSHCPFCGEKYPA